MSDFDDIFDTPVAQSEMKASAQNEQPKKKLEWWQAREQKQRQEAYDTLDNIFKAFSEGKGDVQAYLDTHGRFDRYSARNALLIQSKCPGAKKIGDYKFWQNQGEEILKTERRNPIIILEPGKAYRRDDGTMGQNYYAKEVYDISQTSARGQEQPPNSVDDRLLLKALINKSPVPLQVVEQLPDEGSGAIFDSDENTIFVRKGMDAPDIFRCVSLELARAQMEMVNEEQSPRESDYKAYCVSYMLCKKYGVDTQSYETNRLNEFFSGKDPEEIKSDLKDIENVMGSINSRMAKALYSNKNQKDHTR